MIAFYSACVFMAVCLLIIVISSEGFQQKSQIFLAIIILISNVGYLALALSRDVDGALLATKMTYVGGMFAPIFFFTVVADLCEIKIRNSVRFFHLVFQIILFLIVCLAGYNNWYYKDISYQCVNGMGDLSKSYGPMHTVYILSLVSYAVASLWIAIISVRRRNKVSTKSIVTLFSVLALGIIISRLEKIFNIEIMPLIYDISAMGVYNIIYKVNIFSVKHNVRNEVGEAESIGYVVLDRKYDFMSCNDYMLKIVPEIADFPLETAAPAGNLFSDTILPIAMEEQKKQNLILDPEEVLRKNAQEKLEEIRTEISEDVEMCKNAQEKFGEIKTEISRNSALCKNVQGRLGEVKAGILQQEKMEGYEVPSDNSRENTADNSRENIEKIQEYMQENEQFLITVGTSIYKIHMRPVCSRRKFVYAYVLSLEDVTDRQRYVNVIRQYNHDLEREVEKKTQRIRDIQQKTILGMAQMVESRDLSTGGHIKRTSLVVGVFAKKLLKANMGFDEKFLNYVERSAPMHDLGKIAVDDAILRKQAKYTDEEYEIMKKHSAAGAKIVSDILTGIEEEEFVKIAVNVAHYHHEKVNGKGYPEGLKGEEIPVEARIMALADVFDALVSKRCYKEAFSYDRAFKIIQEDSGTHFDAKLAEVFISCRPELEALYDSFA